MAEKPIDLIIDDTHIAGGAAVVDQNPDIAVGISLPLTHASTGYFHQEYLTIKQVKHNIRNLLLTMKGERVMQPLLGTEIHSILFEQDDGTLGARVQESIQDAFKVWLPFVKVENMNIVSEVENGTGLQTHRNVFHIAITFSLQNDPTMLENITLRLTGPEL